jgi:hypothetical protein
VAPLLPARKSEAEGSFVAEVATDGVALGREGLGLETSFSGRRLAVGGSRLFEAIDAFGEVLLCLAVAMGLSPTSAPAPYRRSYCHKPGRILPGSAAFASLDHACFLSKGSPAQNILQRPNVRTNHPCENGTHVVSCAQWRGTLCDAPTRVIGSNGKMSVDVAVGRWQAFTGATAILEENGRSFAEIAVERGVAFDPPAEPQGSNRAIFSLEGLE